MEGDRWTSEWVREVDVWGEYAKYSQGCQNLSSEKEVSTRGSLGIAHTPSVSVRRNFEFRLTRVLAPLPVRLSVARDESRRVRMKERVGAFGPWSRDESAGGRDLQFAIAAYFFLASALWTKDE